MTPSRDEAPADELTVGGQHIAPGERRTVEIPLARIPAMPLLLSVPVEVVRGRENGPRIWLNAAIHGDELNGIEILRRVRKRLDPAKMRGDVLIIPIVNGFGFMNQSRYLPDRRDLNRSFPGSSRGPLAGRLAAIFMQEVVRQCTHGIDLHTGSDFRTNYPQVRGNLTDPETRRLALAFGAPIAIHSETRDGSLRYAAGKLGKPLVVYEAGEALHFDDDAIRVGTRGVLRVLRALDVTPAEPDDASSDSPDEPTPVATRSQWVRARTSGLLRLEVGTGDRVERRQRIAFISDALGDLEVALRSPEAGTVIGVRKNPLVRRGDAVVHIATRFESPTS